MFTKGQHVVCVNDKFPASLASMYISLPVKGTQYVIRDLYLGQEHPGAQDATCGVLLVGLVNPPDKRGRELGFNSERFAPIEHLEEEIVVTEDKPYLIEV